MPPRKAVHLRWSIATPTLNVVSYEPAEGRLDLTASETCQVAIRLPDGASQALVVWSAQEASAPRVAAVPAQAQYIHIDVEREQRVEIHYPLAEQVAHYQVGAPGRTVECTGYWRGETLMRVELPGPFYPLYRRSADLPPVQAALPSGVPIEVL